MSDSDISATSLAAWIMFGGSISQKKAAKGKVERSFVGPDGERILDIFFLSLSVSL
jgi:hypothetical protein